MEPFERRYDEAEPQRINRWLAQSGNAVASRTRVSIEHRRFASANESATEATTIDAALLATVDVVVTTETALNELDGTEKTALAEAIRSAGHKNVVYSSTLQGGVDFMLKEARSGDARQARSAEHRAVRAQPAITP